MVGDETFFDVTYFQPLLYALSIFYSMLVLDRIIPFKSFNKRNVQEDALCLSYGFKNLFLTVEYLSVANMASF